jgi:hypothetical protein
LKARPFSVSPMPTPIPSPTLSRILTTHAPSFRNYRSSSSSSSRILTRACSPSESVPSHSSLHARHGWKTPPRGGMPPSSN